ncbi:MAG: AAA family ATPase [Bacteroidetes bacterium]|nr:AAA family ATPase [Bacteroidota bacterium]
MAHIKEIEINDFKSFSNFKLKDLGRFNIIIGDNNVGKSSLMEAALVSENFDESILCLHHMAGVRSGLSDLNTDIIIDYYSSQKQNKKFEVAIKYENNEVNRIKCKRLHIDELKRNNELVKLLGYELSLNNVLRNDLKDIDDLFYDVYYVNEIPKALISKLTRHGGYVPFVSSGFFYSSDLVGYYSNFISLNKDNEFLIIDLLSKIFMDLESIKVISEKGRGSRLIVYLKSSNLPVPMSMFGDGFVKLFRIIMELFMCKDGKLMIDEIDSGIYFKKFPFFWKSIFSNLRKYDNQVFATTHSKECLTSLVSFAKENQEFRSFIRIVNLRRNKNGYPMAVCYNFEEFENSIDLKNEIR